MLLNEQGFAIGNGLTNPETQYPLYRDYALQMKLINQAEYYSLNNSVTQCAQAAHSCGNNSHFKLRYKNKHQKKPQKFPNYY